MTPDIAKFAGEILDMAPVPSRILEVGSRDMNGSISEFVEKHTYTGLDREPGKNVNVVASAHDLPYADGSYDIVICLETLGHDDRFWLTLKEMTRVLKPNGMFLLSVPKLSFPECMACKDYYRFSLHAVEQMMEGYNTVDIRETRNSYTALGIKD